jgi:hypothetical protein
MCTTRRLAVAFSLLGSLVLVGCANAVDEQLLLGTYQVTVSANNKTDPAFVVASAGDGAVLFNFTYGFYTDYGAPNATGIRGDIDGDQIDFKSQPIHVDHSTGQIDGTLTGVGKQDGMNLGLTFHVTPTNVAAPAGSPTYDYEIDGPRQ